MTDYAMKYEKKTLREYVTYMITGGSGAGMIPIVICSATLAAIPIAALVGYFMTNNAVMLVVVFCAIVFDILFAVIMTVMVNTYTNKLEQAFTAFDGLVCSVSSEKVILVRDGAPQSVFGWDKITDMHDGRTAFFLKTEDELLIILQKSSVLSGTAVETAEIIAEKQGGRKK